MIIRSFKRKLIATSVGLIMIGLIISIIGFRIGGFDLDAFKPTDTQKWYKTINIDDDFSFSIGF